MNDCEIDVELMATCPCLPCQARTERVREVQNRPTCPVCGRQTAVLKNGLFAPHMRIAPVVTDWDMGRRVCRGRVGYDDWPERTIAAREAGAAR